MAAAAGAPGTVAAAADGRDEMVTGMVVAVGRAVVAMMTMPHCLRHLLALALVLLPLSLL